MRSKFFNKKSRIINFHTAIELIDVRELGDESINFVIELERSISEGNYNKVYDARNKTNSRYFSVFLNRIIDTIRYFKLYNNNLMLNSYIICIQIRKS